MKDKDYKCTKCSADKAYTHEELWKFGDFGNNHFMIEDKNWYCKDHFDQMEAKYNKKLNKEKPIV